MPISYKPREHYIVVFKVNGIYVLATYRKFRSWADAELYTATLPVAREPIIVKIT